MLRTTRTQRRLNAGRRSRAKASRSILAAVAVTASLAFAATANAACIARHHVPIASGSTPEGEAWRVEGTIGNNGSCREWLFGMDFSLPGTINWGWVTGIPAGGHLSDNHAISSSDDLQEDGAWRVFSGSVTGNVRKIVATLSSGKHLVFEPRSAPASLRRKVVWLRNARYFVEYYPPSGFVASASLFDASGKLLRRVPGNQLS